MTTFRNREAARIFTLRQKLFSPAAAESLRDGHHFGAGYESENIFGGFREAALEFFNTRRIKWHGGLTCDTSIVSSQVACLNCFFPFVSDSSGLRCWLSRLYPDLDDVLPISSESEPPLSTMVPSLARLPEYELRLLHERLGGFLSQKSIHLLSRLAAVTSGPLLAHKSLTEIAQLVGSSDPLDVARLAEDCAAYRADRDAEQVLAQHRDTPEPPQELFLSLLDSKQPRPRLRAGLFELWLRAEPKPTGGRLPCGSMDDALPVLHWLLREQAAEVFQFLVGAHHKALEEFVPWFLAKARPHTGYFTGGYKFGSFNMYAFGRPRYAAWARLAQEVQDAAASLGIPFPESLRLPEMPDLAKPTQASLVTSSTGISHRHLKRMAEQLSVREPGKRDSDS